MSPTFTINFRREMYEQQLARTRRRMLSVGVWLAYFGALAVVLGLYGLNCASLTERARVLEAQNLRLGAAGTADRWNPAPGDLAQVERALASPQRWRLRLARLAALLPADVALTAVEGNPDNLTSGPGQEKLLVSGALRPGPGQDRTQRIMGLIATLRADSAFAAQYRSIRLLESRVGGAGAAAEFRLECRR